MEVALTVLGEDRPGIGGEVLGVLVEAGATVLAARGGSVAGRFSFVVVVETDAEEQLGKVLAAAEGRLGLRIMTGRVEAGFSSQGPGERAVLSCYGSADSEALVELFALLGRYNVNVEDIRLERLQGRDRPRLRADLEIRVPVTVDLEVMLGELRELEDRTGLESSLRSDVTFLV